MRERERERERKKIQAQKLKLKLKSKSKLQYTFSIDEKNLAIFSTTNLSFCCSCTDTFSFIYTIQNEFDFSY